MHKVSLITIKPLHRYVEVKRGSVKLSTPDTLCYLRELLMLLAIFLLPSEAEYIRSINTKMSLLAATYS